MTGRSGPKSQVQKDFEGGADEAPTTLYLHCLNTYNKMLSRASRVEDEAGGRHIVYEGMLTKLIVHDMNLSVPYYTSITRALKAMGCVRQLRRGGGSSPSQWELFHEPTEEAFNQMQPKKEPKKGAFQMQQDQINNLNTRINRLEQALDKFLSSVETDEQ